MTSINGLQGSKVPIENVCTQIKVGVSSSWWKSLKGPHVIRDKGESQASCNNLIDLIWLMLMRFPCLEKRKSPGGNLSSAISRMESLPCQVGYGFSPGVRGKWDAQKTIMQVVEYFEGQEASWRCLGEFWPWARGNTSESMSRACLTRRGRCMKERLVLNYGTT